MVITRKERKEVEIEVRRSERRKLINSFEEAIREDERKRICDKLEEMYDKAYDPRPCNRTDNGGMYNDDELNLILEIQEKIEGVKPW